MRRTVLVTGANSGIGLETALHLARLGFRVIGTARSDEKTESVLASARQAGVSLDAVTLEVTDPGRCRMVVETFEPWAVVNNAGYMNVGAVADVPREDALRQLDAMVVAPMHLASLALPYMRARGEGRIVNVSSVVAHTTGAMIGWYQATKHALSAVTDALRREVASDGIDVVLIEPGGMETGIWDKAEQDLLRRRRVTSSPRIYDRSLRILHTVRPFMPTPRPAAGVISDALTAGRPRPRYRVGADAAALELFEAVVPERARDRVIRTALGS